MDTAIVVFTRDLRLHDNPALHQAYVRARQVVPLFVVDPALGTRSANRARFLAESLADLRTSLRERGADLVLRRGDPAAEVIGLATEVHATAVYIADDVSHYATARRHRLERECARHRIELTLTPGLTVVPPGELRPAGGETVLAVPRDGPDAAARRLGLEHVPVQPPGQGQRRHGRRMVGRAASRCRGCG